MSCTHTDSCELYPQISLSSALKVWQVFYCEGDFAKCARFQASSEGQSVPVTLLPNGKELDIELGSAPKKTHTDAMASAMREDVAGSNTGAALSALQDAMDAMSRGETPADPVTPSPSPDPITEPAEDSFFRASEVVGTSGDMTSLDLDAEIGGDVLPGAGGDEPSVSGGVAVTRNPAISRGGPSSSYYLRMRAEDKMGVMSGVIQSLGRHNITVDAMAQKKVAPGQTDTVLIIVTGQAEPDVISAAITELEGAETINGKVVSIPLEYLEAGMFS
ncbi:MAG: hypothetical protein IME93_06645 [Proteobacteria bacterium]|nr:hypothetical protein [Pseudomonadota bacterium]